MYVFRMKILNEKTSEGHLTFYLTTNKEPPFAHTSNFGDRWKENVPMDHVIWHTGGLDHLFDSQNIFWKQMYTYIFVLINHTIFYLICPNTKVSILEISINQPVLTAQ